MYKKISLVLLCLLFVLAAGCKDTPAPLSVDRVDDPSVPEITHTESKFAVNPLTGVADLTMGKESYRPVAVTVNNISVAQSVQTGLGEADIVYETEVEGGITRLVAVYQDISKVEKIGTVRSARYAFIDLAMGHNAIFVHHGQDTTHAGPHLKDVDHFILDVNKGGARLSNGLSSEHTLYAYGDSLWKELINEGYNLQNDSTATWQQFADEDNPVSFDSSADEVSVSFSGSYKTTMKYDASSQKYIRMFNGSKCKDYVTGEPMYFKNVFVLNTTIRTYPNCNDGKNHREVMLNSGSGYYFVNGTYTPIKWEKGAASNPFRFTAEDGTALTVNPGNSWVCIADQSRSKPVIS